jgi:hypothetical protein
LVTADLLVCGAALLSCWHDSVVDAFSVGSMVRFLRMEKADADHKTTLDAAAHGAVRGPLCRPGPAGRTPGHGAAPSRSRAPGADAPGHVSTKCAIADGARRRRCDLLALDKGTDAAPTAVAQWAQMR